MSWFSQWCQCSQWFHAVIHSVMYQDREETHEKQSIPLYTAMKTYYHPTSPIKRSYHTENIDEFNIV